jgi:hypothetical protein
MIFASGSSTYISIANVAGVIGATSTVCFWIKTTQVGPNFTHWQCPSVIGIEQAGGTNDIFPGWIDSSGIWHGGAGNGPFTTSVSALNDNLWHHLAFTYNPVSGQAKLYLDGVLISTVTSETGPKTTACTSFGRQEDTGGSPNYYSGFADDLRTYNRILGDAEIATIFAARGTDGIADGLQYRWQVKEQAPGTVAAGAGQQKDVSSSGNNGTPINSPTYGEGVLRFRRRVA